MKMYRLTTEEIVKLIGKKMDDRSNYNPVQDVNGDWFISEIEHDCCNLGTEAEFIAPEQTPLEL